MSKKFNEPILATIYKVAGIIISIVGVLVAIAALMGAALGGGPSGILGALLALLLTLIMALPFFGIAQIFTYVGKTAFFAEAIHESIGIPLYEIQKSTHAAAESLKTMNTHDGRKEESSNEPSIACPHCGDTISVARIAKGRNTCPTCGQVFDAE